MLIKTFPRSVFQLSSTTVASGIVRRILYGWFVSWFFRSFHGYLTAWRWTDDAWSSRLGVVMVVVSSEERRKELEGGGQAPHTPRFFSFPSFFYKARSSVQDHAAAKKKERSSQATTRARLSVRVAAAARSRPRRRRS